jgi:hypothetical protein
MTAFQNEYLISNIYLNIYISIFMIKYVYENRPYETKLLNRLEIINEEFNLMLYYFMFMFT